MLDPNAFFHDFDRGYGAYTLDPANGGGGAAPADPGPPRRFLDSLVGARQPPLQQGLERAFAAEQHPAVPPAAPRPAPELQRLKSMAPIGKQELANPQHRAAIVQGALARAFGELDRSADFQAFLAKARGLQAAGLAGRELAKGTHPLVLAFLHDPLTQRVHEALRKVGGLDWRTVLAILQGVFYCNAEQRQHYRVWLEAPLKRGANKDIFDTDAVIKLLAGAGLRPGSFTNQPASKAQAHPPDWYRGCIWVLSDFDEPVFYSHMGILGRFHHSSFLSGERIAAGGEWRVDNGVIAWINGASGHYEPETWRFVKTLRLLQLKGIPVGSVLLYRARTEAPLEMPWQSYVERSAEFERDGWKTWPD